MAVLSGKLTKKLVENLGPGRHDDGGGRHRLYIARHTARACGQRLYRAQRAGLGSAAR
jgi:hypothetical protein